MSDKLDYKALIREYLEAWFKKSNAAEVLKEVKATDNLELLRVLTIAAELAAIAFATATGNEDLLNAKTEETDSPRTEED